MVYLQASDKTSLSLKLPDSKHRRRWSNRSLGTSFCLR